MSTSARELRTSRRFGERIGQLALAANAGDAEGATALLDGRGKGIVAGSGATGNGSDGDGDGDDGAISDADLLWLDAKSADVAVMLAVKGRPGALGGYGGEGGYLELLPKRPPVKEDLLDVQAFERFRLLCAVHEGEWGTQQLNTAIERALTAKGLISRRREWYEGRPVMVTRNDAGIGVFNGDIGVVLRSMTAAADAPPRVYFLDGTSIRSVGVSRLAHVETAFALTGSGGAAVAAISGRWQLRGHRRQDIQDEPTNSATREDDASSGCVQNELDFHRLERKFDHPFRRAIDNAGLEQCCDVVIDALM